jgi:hypothetical protein
MSSFLWPRILNPFRKAKFVVYPQDPLLNLGVPWVKKCWGTLL